MKIERISRMLRLGMLALAIACAPAALSAHHGNNLSARDARDLLEGVLEKIEEVEAGGGSAAVVFDIDDTILLTAPRTKTILLGYAMKYPDRFPGLRAKVNGLDPKTMPHGLAQVLESIGITDPRDVRKLRRYWLPRLLSNHFLTADWPIDGAKELIAAILDRGACVYYVTARAEKDMSPGTQESLVKFGFPVDHERAHLVMNPLEFEGSPEFKHAAMMEIAGRHTIVAIFENEPGNLNAMHAAAPEATPVHLNTVHQADAPPLGRGIVAIPDYSALSR